MPFNIKPFGETVRLKHLMSHTSGIPALAYAEQIISGAIGANDDWLPIATAADMLTFMQGAEDWTWTKPGERWFYFNEGYVLLGAIIEQLSGLSFNEYIKQHIFAPLGMTRSYLAQTDVEADGDVAVPYVNWAEKGRIPSAYIYSGIDAAGGIISNVGDLLKYANTYLKHGQAVAKESSLAELVQPRVKTPVVDSPFGVESYGYGWGIKSDFLGHTLINHGGSVGIATAYLAFIPEEDVSVAVLTNGSGYATGQFAMYGLAALLGQDPEALPFVKRERQLLELEGVYQAYKNTMQLEVRRAGDLLTLTEKDKFGTNSTIVLPDTLEQNKRSFYVLNNGSKVYADFYVDEKGIQLVYERYLLRKTGSLS